MGLKELETRIKHPKLDRIVYTSGRSAWIGDGEYIIFPTNIKTERCAEKLCVVLDGKHEGSPVKLKFTVDFFDDMHDYILAEDLLIITHKVYLHDDVCMDLLSEDGMLITKRFITETLKFYYKGN